MRTFTVSVSRMAKGKAGYRRNKRAFGNSFYPEQHTVESLIKLAAVDGYSFLAGEFARRPPAFYGRDDVCTYRITENFRQTYIIPLDDDGDNGNALEFWQNDKLFQTFGAGFYHSSSSTPEKPKLRILFELDKPITDPKAYQEARRAFGWYYPRIDVLPQVPQVWYGSETPREYKILANVLPVDVLERVVLNPYREVVKAQAVKQQLRARHIDTPSNKQVERVINWLAQRQPGDNRNICLLWASGKLKELGESWQTVGEAVIQATRANGYYEQYAGAEREIERIFDKGQPV